MNFKVLAIGAAALGFLATTSATKAMPAAPLGTVATDSSSVVQKAHWRLQRHIHRGARTIYLKPGTMETGRSAKTTAPMKEKKMEKMEKMEKPAPHERPGY